MNGLELNKIAAAILLAGTIAMTISLGMEGLYKGGEGHGGEEPKRGYSIAGAGEVTGTTEVAAASGPVDILPFLQTVDLKKGEELVKRCTSCHSFEKGGPNKVGPNQWGIIGSMFGHKEDYSYSDALKAEHGKKTWGFQEMSDFLENPKKYLPGTKMAYAGIKKPEDRANLIAYLNTLSDKPLAIPKVDPAAAKPAEAAAAPATTPADGAAPAAPAEAPKADINALLKTADLKLGEQLIKRCTSCHSFEKGGPNRVGPNQWGVVGGDFGHVEGFSYSDAIKALHGQKKWTFAELDAFLENPKKYLPGTKMSFAGIKKPEERAALIAYLNTLSDKPLPLPK
jgi:cytochrome c